MTDAVFPTHKKGWRLLQVAVWLVGLTIFTCLLFFPPVGIMLFWNILIPVAPLLIVVAVGVWRNVCPMASVILLPRHLGVSKRKIMPRQLQSALGLISVAALYLIVPLRHAMFNTNGPATALLIGSMVMIGILMGLRYEWKSAWCSSLCPVHPVEKLYGNNVFGAVRNAHCDNCMNCVIPCPDSTPNMHPRLVKKSFTDQWSGWLITGGLPGFVWGWFHVPDQHGITGFAQTFAVYRMPLTGMAVTLLIYIILEQTKAVKENWLVRAFAAAAVSCYYWYRIPALLGFGKFTGDGMLFDASAQLPVWIVTGITVLFTCFFIYWLLVRKPNKQSWVVRPAFAEKK